MDLCWFCEKNPGEQLLEVTLAKRTSSAAGLEKHVKYESAKVPIPRCSKCATIHRWVRNAFAGYMIAGGLAGLIITISLVAVFYKKLMALNNLVLVFVIVLLLVPFGALFFLAYFAFEKKKKKKYFNELVGKSKIRLDNQETLIKHPAVDAWAKILGPRRGDFVQIYWKK